MKNFSRKIITAVITSLIAVSFILPLSASAATEKIKKIKDVTETPEFFNCGVIDNKFLFDYEQSEKANEAILKTAEKLNMYICVELGDQHYYSEDSLIDHCDYAYDDYFGENTDGIYYYIDLAGYSDACDHISTSGKACLIYKDSGINNCIDSIFSALDAYLPSSGEPIYSDDILDTVEAFCRQLENYYDDDISPFAYHYSPADDDYIYMKDGRLVLSDHKPLIAIIKYLPFGFAAGIIVTLISIFIISSSYKFKKSFAASSYVSKNKTVFKIKTDDFMREYTTKVKIETSSGGGGGGGHHGGGGGGHHGGGSHHR